MDGFFWALSIVQDGVHLLGDGHFYAASLGEAYRGCCREDSFGDHAVHSSDDVRQFLAAAKFDSHAAIAREASGAGEDEIAESGETRHGVGAASAGDDQASHLREAASNECGDGVVSQPQTITDSG